MPRGQYDRSAHRKPKPEIEPEVFVNPDREVINRTLRPKVDADPNATDEQRALVGLPPREMHPEVAEIARLLVASAPPQPMPIIPARETFDAWVDEDVTPLPADTRLAQVVGEWAASVCPGWHTVMYLATNDGMDITVELTTEHGTTILTEPAGQWREADIADALARMRVKLKV